MQSYIGYWLFDFTSAYVYRYQREMKEYLANKDAGQEDGADAAGSDQEWNPHFSRNLS